MMKLLKYLPRVWLYLTIAGITGLVQVVKAKLTHAPAVVEIRHRDCRHPLRVRFPASDTFAFEQIFVNRGYEFTVKRQPKIIVDVGANIGLAAIYFANRYPDATIIAMEPEQNNFTLLQQNVAPYPNIVPLQAALWHCNEELVLLDPGRKEWGYTTWREEEPAATCPNGYHSICHSVTAFTVDHLMGKYGLDRIDILKIDIEGAEKEVFSDTSLWIDKIDALIVELHDWLRAGCRDAFYKGVHGFDDEWRQGENLILTKGRWLTRSTA